MMSDSFDVTATIVNPEAIDRECAEESVDVQERIAESLGGYLKQFSATNAIVSDTLISGNRIELKLADGSSMDIECKGSEYFEASRWYSLEDVANGIVGWESATNLNSDEVVGYARHYLTTGNW